MKKNHIILFYLLFLSFYLLPSSGCSNYFPAKGTEPRGETVICVHGLFDTGLVMRPMARYFARLGYDVHIITYSSTRDTVEHHIQAFEQSMKQLNISKQNRPVHFVAHSMGGIIVRGYLNNLKETDGIGRIVTIATPHKGSPVADALSPYAIPEMIVVPVHDLKTEGPTAAVHMENPALRFETGTIAGGTGRVNGFNPDIGEDNDGVVPFSSSHLKGEKDSIRLPYTHSLIHQRKATFEQAANFIMHGKFIHE